MNGSTRTRNWLQAGCRTLRGFSHRPKQRTCPPALSITNLNTMILARAPLSLRSQVARLRVASPARHVHGHGEYHVYFSCSSLGVSLIGSNLTAFTFCVPGQKTRGFWHQTLPLPHNRFQYSFCCRGVPVVSLSFPSLIPAQRCTMQEEIRRCLITLPK